MSTWNQQSDDPAAPQTSPGHTDRQESEGSRGRVSETISRTTGREPSELGSELGYVVRRNALPLALIGAGAVWLATSLSRGRNAHDDLQAAGEYAGNAGRRAAAYARKAGSTAGAKAAVAREQARTSMNRGREAAAERAKDGRETTRGAFDNVRDAYHHNPLLVGLLAAGGAAALATAVTARSSGGRFIEYAREQASAVADRAAEQAREEASKARNVAERTARAASETARETAVDEAQRQGLAGAERFSDERETGPGNGSAGRSGSAAGNSGNSG